MIQNNRSLIVSDLDDSPEGITVQDLLKDNYTGWDEGLVRNLFNQLEANMILTIPFSIH